MALNSFQLFLSQVQTAPEVLKLRVLQVVFDVLMVHEGDFLANASVGVGRFHYLRLYSCELIQTCRVGNRADESLNSCYRFLGTRNRIRCRH